MRIALPLAILGIALGCGGTPPGRATVAPSPATCERQAPRRGPLVRLAPAEYDATVRDLLGDDSQPSSAFPREPEALAPDGAPVSPVLAGAYLRAAETLAERASAERLEAIAPCVAGGDESDACVRTYVAAFGRRAYRRPLTDAEVERFVAIHREGGVRLVLVAMLVSPHFLYRVEHAGVLSMYERASRLSYLLWGSMPDETLFAAAGAGALGTADAMEVEARRMLADPRARPQLVRFVSSWLELSLDDVTKDDVAYPEWRPELARAMRDSSSRFVEHVLFESTGTLDELFRAPYAFVDDSLAPIYGVPPPGSDTLVRVALDPRSRAGIFTQPAFLAAHASADGSSPVLRGRALRERVFCQALPAPPDDVRPLAPVGPARPTTRARFEAHVEDAGCAGCHTLMDPLGFALEHFDGLGRFRADENGEPIDAGGEIFGTGATDGPVDGAIALAGALASSQDVSRCAMEQAWRFALRRPSEEADACDREALAGSWARSGGELRELLVAIVRSDAFVAPGPELPR